MTQKIRKTRTQKISRKLIIAAATDVFADNGFRGSTLDQIAAQAGMSKPNLLYYYSSKLDVYMAAIDDTLDIWLEPLEQLDEDGDPETELSKYIEAKLEFSRLYPNASRLFASEVLHGAKNTREMLETRLKDLLAGKAKVIRRWSKNGQLVKCDPYNLIFLIFAATQTYADFAAQIDAVVGKSLDDEGFRAKAVRDVRQIILHGVLA